MSTTLWADVYAGRSSADPGPLFIDLCLERRDELHELLATRQVNTNEVGRSAILGPALTTVAGYTFQIHRGHLPDLDRIEALAEALAPPYDTMVRLTSRAGPRCGETIVLRARDVNLGTRVVDIVLPNGVVCDGCNNGVLAQLDQTICDFLPIKMRRTMLGIASKSGTVPETRFSTGSLRHDGPSHLNVRIDGPSDNTTFREVRRDGDDVEFTFKWRGGHKVTPRYASMLSRALLKSALECAWLDHGDVARVLRLMYCFPPASIRSCNLVSR